VAVKVFVNGHSRLTSRGSVSDFTKKSGILVGRGGFQIQFLASRQADVYNEQLLQPAITGESNDSSRNLPVGDNFSFSSHFESTTAAARGIT